MGEAISAGALLPLHEIDDCDRERSLEFRRAKVVLLAGDLSQASLERGKRQWEEGKEETLEVLRNYCVGQLKKGWMVSLLLVEGSVDSRIRTELSAQGITAVSGLGSRAVYNVSRHAGMPVLADLFSAEEWHVRELETCLMRSGGKLPSESCMYVARSEDSGSFSMDADTYFLAVRSAEETVSEGPRGRDPVITLFVSSLLEDKCRFLASRVKKNVNRVLSCLAHGFLPGKGDFELELAEELRGALSKREPRRGQSDEGILEALVVESFASALEDLVALSFRTSCSGLARGGRPGDDDGGGGGLVVHYDGFHERSCGMRRAVEMVVTFLATDAVLTNNPSCNSNVAIAKQ